MFTSDKRTEVVLKNAFTHLIFSIICAFVGAVYERFSHEVYSYYMIYAFAFPLVLGALPLFIIGLFGKRQPGKLALNAWNSGIAALTVGSIFKGVLDIYGTTNRLIIVYPAAAGVLMSVGLIAFIAGKSTES